MYTQQCCTAHS